MTTNIRREERFDLGSGEPEGLAWGPLTTSEQPQWKRLADTGQVGMNPRRAVGLHAVAARLAARHFNAVPEVAEILLFSDNEDFAIRLVEVNTGAIPFGQVTPFFHRPGVKVPVPVLVADIAPDELAMLENGALPMPEGWPTQPTTRWKREPVGAA